MFVAALIVLAGNQRFFYKGKDPQFTDYNISYWFKLLVLVRYSWNKKVKIYG